MPRVGPPFTVGFLLPFLAAFGRLGLGTTWLWVAAGCAGVAGFALDVWAYRTRPGSAGRTN
ncbi:MAG: hypothetical protein AB1816_03685 [Bacillota bacterium]